MTNELPVNDGIVIQLNKFKLSPVSGTAFEETKSMHVNMNGNATDSVAIAHTIPTFASLNTKALSKAPNKGIQTISMRRYSEFIYYPLSIRKSSTSTVALAL